MLPFPTTSASEKTKTCITNYCNYTQRAFIICRYGTFCVFQRGRLQCNMEHPQRHTKHVMY